MSKRTDIDFSKVTLAGIVGLRDSNADMTEAIDEAAFDAACDMLELNDYFKCDHCGAHLRSWAAVVMNADTAEVWGVTCAVEAELSDSTAVRFNRLKKRAANAAEKARIAAEMAKFLADNADLADYIAEVLQSIDDAHFSKFSDFERDVCGKLRNYGSLSEKQADALRRAKARNEERAARFAAEAENAEPVVEGRNVIEGVVLSQKSVDSEYGTTWKMLVKLDNGSKVWGTIPSAIFDINNGDRVRFTATVEKSDRDETFGFFKRPTKAEVLVAATA